MQRISSWTDLVAAPGRFRYGTVAGGVAPTPLKAEWLNQVQEELCNFVLAYLPGLDSGDNAQLLKAMQVALLNHYTRAQTDNLIAALVDSSPGALDTLRELASALGNDPNFATTMINFLALKAPLASPELTGTPLAPTAPYGTKTKQLATCEFVQFGVQSAYPVGSVYLNAADATNPASLFGFGVWQPLGQGRMLIGAGTGTDARGEARAFALGEQSGEYNHVLVASEMPAHHHNMPQGHPVPDPGGAYTYTSGDDLTTAILDTPAPPTTEAGGGLAHNNLSPYLAVHMWRRTS